MVDSVKRPGGGPPIEPSGWKPSPLSEELQTNIAHVSAFVKALQFGKFEEASFNASIGSVGRDSSSIALNRMY